MVYFWFKKCVFILVLLCLQLYWLRAVQLNARSACDASMFTSCIYIFLRLASKCLNCTRSPEEIVQKLHKYDWKHKINSLKIDSDNFTKLPLTFLVKNNNENWVKFAKFFNILLNLIAVTMRCQLKGKTVWNYVRRPGPRIVTAIKFNKMLTNFANFTRFSALFSTKKVTGSLVTLSESIFKVFILCFQSYLCSFCTISSGLRVQFRHLLANLRKIYIHDVNIDASQADRALNWTERNQ